MKRLLVAVLAVAALAAAPSAHAAHTTSEHVATMDDGVGIAVTLYRPDGLTGAAPAVMVFHGLGWNRQSMAPVARVVPQRARIAIRDVQLQVPVLRTPVSR